MFLNSGAQTICWVGDGAVATACLAELYDIEKKESKRTFKWEFLFFYLLPMQICSFPEFSQINQTFSNTFFLTHEKILAPNARLKKLLRWMILQFIPLSFTPYILTMLFSSRSGCEKSCPVGNVFPMGQHHGSIIVPPATLSPTQAWLMCPGIVFQKDHWDHWVACCFKG